MPIAGGTSDKLGNAYESLWAVDNLLKILSDDALTITMEPINRAESLGVEFIVRKSDAREEYWSVKRQASSASGWTISQLMRSRSPRRSILSDLASHLQNKPGAVAVFASMSAARPLMDLAEYARKEQLAERVDQNQCLRDGLEEIQTELFSGDEVRTANFLSRVQVRVIDHDQLAQRIQTQLSGLLCTNSGDSIDPVMVRTSLEGFLWDNFHCPVNRTDILAFLKDKQLMLRNWAAEITVADRVRSRQLEYTSSIELGFINSAPIPRSPTPFNIGHLPKRAIVLGAAGSGKSCFITSVVSEAAARGVPVLPIRFDDLPSGIITPRELGARLDLPESPAIVLQGLASGGECVLVVDQLDAISLASGKNTELWGVFEKICREADSLPGLKIICACREFDFEHDYRIRRLVEAEPKFDKLRIGQLEQEGVKEALAKARRDPLLNGQRLLEVLQLPLHLWMYLGQQSPEGRTISTKEELFDRFWEYKVQQVNIRLGGHARWTSVIDKLLENIESSQRFAVPESKLDEYRHDADAMASEHVLTRVDGKWRFFHESFFDYAYARRFESKGHNLLDVLRNPVDGQGLFHRQKIRQLLTYLRGRNRNAYLESLREVLLEPQIRFHLKRLAVDVLSSLSDPTAEEFGIVCGFSTINPKYRQHFLQLVTGSAPWFSVADQGNYFADAFSSQDATQRSEAANLIMQACRAGNSSPRLAEILMEHRQDLDRWHDHMKDFFRLGNNLIVRGNFRLFLGLLGEGEFDADLAGERDVTWFWHTLFAVKEREPAWACEAISVWLSRIIPQWVAQMGPNGIPTRIGQYLASGGFVLDVAAKAPGAFAANVLPQVVAAAESYSKDSTEELAEDPFWHFRSNEKQHLGIFEAVLEGVARSLESLARSSPKRLCELLSEYKEKRFDTVAFLVLRAWTAAPVEFADQIAVYLCADPRRLYIGYTLGGQNQVSYAALEAAGKQCSPENFALLESLICHAIPNGEKKCPRNRGWTQFQFLLRLPVERMSDRCRSQLGELQRKFPETRMEVPETLQAGFVGSPIPNKALPKLTDEQWLAALRDFRGIPRRLNHPIPTSGGEREVAGSLQEATVREPLRFLELAKRNEGDFSASYLEAVLNGVVQAAKNADEVDRPAVYGGFVDLVQRLHEMDGHPCGQAIMNALAEWPQSPPVELSAIIGWYCENGGEYSNVSPRDPSEGAGRDILLEGINSPRGVALRAAGRLVREKPEFLVPHIPIVEEVLKHASDAACACLIEIIMAAFPINESLATNWAVTLGVRTPAALASIWGTTLLRKAVFTDYCRMRPVLAKMLESDNSDLQTAAAQQICLAALDKPIAEQDAKRVRAGTEAMRVAAADVYVNYSANAVVGKRCRDIVAAMFADTSDKVRRHAAHAFSIVGKLLPNDKAGLLRAVVESKFGPAELGFVVDGIEKWQDKLPDEVADVAEFCLSSIDRQPAAASAYGSSIQLSLPAVVVRLYAQTQDVTVKSRCLDVFDTMLLHQFYNVTPQLELLER